MAASKNVEFTIKEITNQDVGLSLIMNQKLPIIPSWRFGQWKESTEKITKAANKKRENLIKELGTIKADKMEVVGENKVKFHDQFKALMDEKEVIAVPEITVDLLKDVSVNIRFTTLIGQHLKTTDKYQKSEMELSHQKILDMDIGLSIIMNELLPITLAMKLGESKRISEMITVELRELKEKLTWELGALNADFDYEITNDDKKFEFDTRIQEFMETKRKIEAPMYQLSEFETKVQIGDKKEDLKFPLRFFALFRTFMKDQN